MVTMVTGYILYTPTYTNIVHGKYYNYVFFIYYIVTICHNLQTHCPINVQYHVYELY